MKEPRGQAPRNTSSPAARRTDRARAEAEGLAMIERATKARREKSAKLKALREAREAARKK